MSSRTRDAVVVASLTIAAGIVLGAVMGVVWWWVAPTEEWTVTDSGLFPADVGFNAWFAADGWFLVLGTIAGLLLTLITWRRGRRQPVALVVAVIAAAAFVALTAWTLGGMLGPTDPTLVAETAGLGTTLPGALGLRALGVLCAPALAALTLLALLIASARVDEPANGVPQAADVPQVPQPPW